MAREGFCCIHCGAKFAWQPGSDICCGEDCARQRAEAIAEAKAQLTELGFVQFTAAPNIWVKDFVAVTIEQVLNEGIDAVIESHSGAVVEHQAFRASQS